MVGTGELVQLVSTTQSTNCAVPVGCENFLLRPAMAAGRAVDKERLAPHALMHRLPATLPMFLFLADVLLPRRQGSLQPHWEHQRELLKLNHQEGGPSCQKMQEATLCYLSILPSTAADLWARSKQHKMCTIRETTDQKKKLESYVSKARSEKTR